ncbi:MAG: hypothetical protein AVDCRST_MAG51-2147, partial [uncultured Ramlibacter sp.]
EQANQEAAHRPGPGRRRAAGRHLRDRCAVRAGGSARRAGVRSPRPLRRRVGGRLHCGGACQRHDAARAVCRLHRQPGHGRGVRPGVADGAGLPRVGCTRRHAAAAGGLRAVGGDGRPQVAHASPRAAGALAADRRVLQRAGGPAARPPVQPARPQQRLPATAHPPDAGGHRPGHRRSGGLRRAGLGARTDLQGGAGQLRPARPVPAGGDRRPQLRRRRVEEDHACDGGAGRRRRPDAVPQSAGALQRDRGTSAHAPARRAAGAAHPAHRRRRPAGGPEPDLPLDDPFAPGAGHEALRASLPGHRHPSLRAGPPRPRAVPGQHLQLPAAARTGRARLPADPGDAARPARPAGAQARAPRHHFERRRAARGTAPRGGPEAVLSHRPGGGHTAADHGRPRAAGAARTQPGL